LTPTNPKALAALGVAGVAAAILTSPDGSEENEESESDKSACPICGKSVDPRGLSGHLQFGHDIAGENVSEVISSGLAESVEVTNESD
jgi:tetrahydromethanopterin S-methyltransferase subunit E